MTEQILKAILMQSGKTIVSKSEMETLRQVQKDFEFAANGLTQYNRQAASEDWVRHKEEHVSEVRENGRLRELPALTRSEFESSYAIKSEAHREKQRQLCQSILPLATAISERFVKVAEAAAAEIAEKESKLHELYGIPREPSRLVIAFSKAALMAKARVPQSYYAAFGPKAMLPYLDF
jgi:hypothetical protein